MKPSTKQLLVIKAIANELSFWETSNDIHSPSHATSIDEAMNMLELDNVLTEQESNELAKALCKVWALIAGLSPCLIRAAERERLKK